MPREAVRDAVRGAAGPDPANQGSHNLNRLRSLNRLRDLNRLRKRHQIPASQKSQMT